MFCKNCGKEIGNDMKFCDGCGAPVEQQAGASNQAPNTPPPVQPYVAPAESSDSSNKIIFVLSYLGILFFLPLVVCPNSSVGKFHANQGLLLLILSIVGSILFSIIAAVVPFLYFLSVLFSLAVLALAVYGMVNAYNEKQIPLPVIGNLFVLIK